MVLHAMHGMHHHFFFKTHFLESDSFPVCCLKASAQGAAELKLKTRKNTGTVCSISA